MDAVSYNELFELRAALRRAFQIFPDDEPITPKMIADLGEEHLRMIMDPGPQEITFYDDLLERERKIVFESGDWEAGIPDGWFTADEPEEKPDSK